MGKHQAGKNKTKAATCRVRVQRRLLLERLSERRLLAAITGTVFEDADHSFRQEPGETALAGRIVYLDTNDNALLEQGEAYALTGEDGGFLFDDLADGDYILRLFNGTQAQRQTVPFEATLEGSTVSVSNGIGLTLTESPAVALTTNSIVLGDLQSGNSRTIPVAENLNKMQNLPDGTVLVVGGYGTGDTAWVVDLIGRTSDPIDLSGNGEVILWGEVAIDGDGHGVLLEDSPDESTVNVRAIDASDPDSPIQVTDTGVPVPNGTKVLTSDTGSRSVFGWLEDDTLQLSLWSNQTESFITETPIEVSGATDLLDYDDASGLLLLRNDDGGVGVHDVDANFAPLNTFTDITGPVKLDGPRDLLVSVSPVDSMLRLTDLRDGSKIADLAVDLSTVGSVSHVATHEKPDAVVVLGAAGMTEIALNRPASREVTVDDGEDVDSVLFGVSINGTNSPPRYESFPDLSTPEDFRLVALAPAALQGAVDPDGDSFVLLEYGVPNFGNGFISSDGAIDYQPNRDFNGTDHFPVALHDGMSVSEEIQLPILVTPLPDPPTDVDINVRPVPEDIFIGGPIGDIEVVDVDGDDHHIIQINDPRFRGQNGRIIFVGGNIDFESETLIPLVISVSDLETNTTLIRQANVPVTDANDPITAITPTTATVFENAVGDIIAELLVHDQDVEQFHSLSVDDERFVIDGIDLRLADGVSLDYESERQITVRVTATEFGAGGTFTQPITITVLDLPEQPSQITLTNQSVLELEPGDVVGDVLVDGSASGYDLTVDDPRFEIDGNTLKLKDDVFVELATQSQIQLTITAQDSGQVFVPLSDTFVIQLIENPTPYHNDDSPYDVDNSGEVTALDALLIINYLNTYGPGPVGHGDPGFGFDVNSDGFVTALDALLVLNELNRQDNGGGTVGSEDGEEEEGEGERIAPAPSGLIAGEDGQSMPSIDQMREVVFSMMEKESANAYSNDARVVEDHRTITEAREADESREFTEGVDATLRLLSDRVN